MEVCSNDVKINLDWYDNIIFDNDGVLLDTNRCKEENIRRVVSGIVNQRDADDFVSYFTRNNGIPREIKIRKFFSPKETETILLEYSSLNKRTLVQAETTAGLVPFLEAVRDHGLSQYVLSGGDEREVVSVLGEKRLLGYFQGIRGGPRTKDENFVKLNLKGPSLFIGDSLVDHNLAQKHGLDFVFMYGYTQFVSWREYFEEVSGVLIVKDFVTLLGRKN